MRKLFPMLLVSVAVSACVDQDPVSIESTSHVKPQASSVAFNGFIRVGVVQNAAAATGIFIGSADSYTIQAKTSGATLMTGANGSVKVTATVGITRWYVQVTCSSGASLQATINKVVSFGHPYTTEFSGPPAFCTRVLVGNFFLSDPFPVRNAFRNTLISQGFATFPTTRSMGGTTYRVTRGTTFVQTDQPPVLMSTTDRVTIAGRVYRGKAEIIANSVGGLAGVNELHIEQYLYGVVPRELGPIAYPEIEAQKAQAIAARTYALAGIGKRASDGYDLRASTDDQVYGGFQDEHPVSNAAIDATRGVVLTYNGTLISANYSSASGGHTANNEEAFASAPVAYLRGVPDAERGKAFEHVPNIDVFRSHANAMSLRNAKESDFESGWSRFHRWSYEWTAEEISKSISAWKGFDVGEVTAINVLDRGPSGRVTLIEYVTANGTFTHARDAIRGSLRFYNAANALVNLPSTLFFVEPAKGKQNEGGFVVYGGGFGHGVGMAQTGAVGMAEKGHTYDEILKHYYRDVDLTQKY